MYFAHITHLLRQQITFYMGSMQDATCTKFILAQEKDTKLYISLSPHRIILSPMLLKRQKDVA